MGVSCSRKLIAQIEIPVCQQSRFGVELSGARGGPELFWHGGSHTGFQAVFCGCLHTGQGVVAMLNGSEGGLLWEVARAVAREYRWPEMP